VLIGYQAGIVKTQHFPFLWRLVFNTDLMIGRPSRSGVSRTGVGLNYRYPFYSFQIISVAMNGQVGFGSCHGYIKL